MHPAPLLAASAAVALAVSLISGSFGAPGSTSDPASDSSLSVALERLTARLDALEQRGDSLSGPAAAPVRLPDAQAAALDIEETVRRLVDPSALAAPEPEAPGWPGGTSDVLSAYRLLEEAGFRGEEANALWAEAEANDQLHDLLDEMEIQMELVPESGDKHFQRATAYYAAASVRPWNDRGNWWVDSDEAFSQALDLEPEHWDARYEKARNLSFWPVAYGGQARAIGHFETLVEQQEGRPQEPRFAQSYRWLGNLYDQQGRHDEAVAMWQQGLSLFPDDAALAKKLEF